MRRKKKQQHLKILPFFVHDASPLSFRYRRSLSSLTGDHSDQFVYILTRRIRHQACTSTHATAHTQVLVGKMDYFVASIELKGAPSTCKMNGKKKMKFLKVEMTIIIM